MKTITLAGGVLLSEIALGAGKLGDLRFPEETLYPIWDRYTELGGFTFDTARLYAEGRCDAALGRWLKSRSFTGKAAVVTKGSHPDRGNMFVSRLSCAEIEGDLDASLNALGLECSALHLLHRDDVKLPVEDIMPVLDSLVKSGKTRAVGVSNWTASRIGQANAFARENNLAELTCCQAHYSLAQTTAPATGDLTHVSMNDVELNWYREFSFPLMAFSTQGRGWFAKRAKGEEPTEAPKRYYDGFPENWHRLERLMKLSQETGRSLSAITTAYARDSLPAAIPLCAYSSVAQLEDSMDALRFTLTREQVKFLETGLTR